ncbi:predicted protein [Chaetomium globosum CBS 148.51]|uniref:Uncharacterized protein n=1 Tax=Chaetomium globosum (strain ATCC 6205 / CBS 148.51 / DSM 1962 / NBRC 6347 / NRRL 1970) TaxID=306901 RepID=Q2GTY7_CHAGB|nr:uncharacterized protein CHGG_08567 [Chaetomium globosum CBS 148.51]EAQ84553.1 predicted protein [Chaetomium globosum CBS 148.51]
MFCAFNRLGIIATTLSEFARPSQNQQDETVQRDHLATPPAPWPEGMPKGVPGVTCQGRGEIWWARVRVSYHDGPGASVYGWPAKGGIYVHTASAVEIEFLGFDRFKPVPHPSPNNPSAAPDEEAHCNKMRQLGAVWWKSEYAWSEDKRTVHYRPPPDPPNSFIVTGWPTTGGVWVLSTTKGEAVEKRRISFVEGVSSCCVRGHRLARCLTNNALLLRLTKYALI